jgi:hypothetical protein
VSAIAPVNVGVRLGERTLDVLITAHRWLGTALCLVFAAWFASGIVMMYAGYPLLSEADKLARTPQLDLTAAQLTPAEAYRRAGFSAPVDSVRLGTMLDRPTYFFLNSAGWTAVRADDGALQPAIDADAAAGIAREFEVGAGAPRYVGRFDAPDQWTIYTSWAPYLQGHDFSPFHKLAFGDGTEVYVLAATGDVIQRTTPSERFWGYLGPVVHWIYPTTFRTQYVDAWDRLIVWLSALGTVLCVSGVVIGIYFFRWRREPGVAASPYRGWMKWHHWIGLVFGVLAGTWVFSGLLSMDPWSWSTTDDSPDGAQVERMSGGGLDLDAFAAPPSVAASACRAQLNVKEIRLLQLGGVPYYYCSQTPQRSALVAADGSGAAPFASFEQSALVDAARAIMPRAQVASAQMLDGYDAYYYPGWEDKLENGAAKRLPVLKIVFDDAEQTLVYVDPFTGTPVKAYDSSGRWYRWLFHGLHSFDFAALYRLRPLWDLIVLPLMLGGVAVSVTGTWIGYKWLKRKVRKPKPQQKRRTAPAP